MYILLTPEMNTKIRATDEFYNYGGNTWEIAELCVGRLYTDSLRPFRRKITSLADLGEVLMLWRTEREER